MESEEHKIERSQYTELQNHNGSKNYEVVEIFDTKFEITPPELDVLNKQLVIYGKTGSVENNNFQSQRIKVSVLGNITGDGITNAKLKKDGSLHGFDFYTNWLVNGDTTKLRYLDPFSGNPIPDPYEFNSKEKNPKKWLEKFKELYSNSEYVFVDISFYYFKIDSKWYLMEAELEGLPENIEQQYPPKENKNVRMVELENLAPLWYHKGFKERDTSLIKMVDYESTFYEEQNSGLDTYKYSAGWWYLEIYMPLGDTLKIKRYSYFQDPDLKLYKIPAAYGGRNDVLFIVQKPKNSHIEQVAGMYVIRPRDPEQPESKYSHISYITRENGKKEIRSSKETDDYRTWKEKSNGDL